MKRYRTRRCHARMHEAVMTSTLTPEKSPLALRQVLPPVGGVGTLVADHVETPRSHPCGALHG